VRSTVGLNPSARHDPYSRFLTVLCPTRRRWLSKTTNLAVTACCYCLLLASHSTDIQPSVNCYLLSRIGQVALLTNIHKLECTLSVCCHDWVLPSRPTVCCWFPVSQNLASLSTAIYCLRFGLLVPYRAFTLGLLGVLVNREALLHVQH
jgi:hypothetical protein